MIKIIGKDGKDYCINTSEETRDMDILEHYDKTNDFNLLCLLSDAAKYFVKKSAIFSIENNSGDVDKAKEIVKNI